MKKNNETPANVSDYIAQQPQPVQKVLKALRKTILAAAPGAEELISYQMPAYKLNGPLVYFGAFKEHCSFFPGSKLSSEFSDALKSFRTSTGTIQFTPEHPLPPSLVAAIVKQRVAENEAKLNSKKKASKK